MDTTIQETTNYDQFGFLTANREQSRGHIEALKRAFQDIGNLTQVQPILVNENFKIIDGQHRFTACQELGLPVFYTVANGTGISEARSMNVLHRSWTMKDYADSYAATGDPNYQKFLTLSEDYGFTMSVTLYYANGSAGTSIFKKFRQGDFVMHDYEATQERLEKLSQVRDLTPLAVDRNFAVAFLPIMQAEIYDHQRFLRKLERVSGTLTRKASIEDYKRLIEDVYNYGQSESTHVRLF